MQALGFFAPQANSMEYASNRRNILYHCDLEPRNILVVPVYDDIKTRTEQRWRISSVLDWDDALSVPAVLTRMPPVWLWDFSEDDSDDEAIPKDYDGDFDLLPADLF